MDENDRRILAKACGLCWHEYRQDDEKDDYYRYCIHCGCSRAGVGDGRFNPTLPDNWEMVRVKVVVPNQEAFCEHLDKHGVWMIIWFSLSSEDRNKIAANFIKSRPALFPWAVEMEGR